MDAEHFLNWRKTLRFTQKEAGEKLGVSRATVQNWEKGITRVPRIAEFACWEITQRWKQRPEYGPVTLVYADEPTQLSLDDPARSMFVQCELYSNNQTAVRRALRLNQTSVFASPLIIEQGGGIIWSSADLLHECDQRTAAVAQGTVKAR